MILGLDISTTTIGYTVMDNNEQLNMAGAIKLNSKNDQSLFDRLNKAMEIINALTGNTIQHIAIEAPLVMFNRGGSSAQTIAKLNQFNGMISAAVYNTYSIEPIYYNVATARKLALPGVKFPKGSNRKEIVLAEIMATYPDLAWPLSPRATYDDGTPKPKAECGDIADSIVIALAHCRSL